MLIGYARVSKIDQNLEYQEQMLRSVGCEKIFSDKLSGKLSSRQELNNMLLQLRSGDTIIVNDLTRLSRSVKDLYNLVEQIHLKGANLKSIREPWLDTTTPYGNLMFSFFAGLSQFERELISIRTREGLLIAKQQGRMGGRKKSENRKKNEEYVYFLYKEKTKISHICDLTNLSRTTIYRIVNEKKNELGEI